METKIARPVGSNHRAPRATINKPVAIKRPQTWERPNLIRRTPTKTPAPRAAPIATRATETSTTTGSRLPVPGSSRRPTSSAPIYSRPGPSPRPGRNFSRLQGVSGYGNGAAPIGARPNLRGRAVREVGFENWPTRHESVFAQPLRARSRPARIPSAIQEEDEDAESDVLPVVPPPKLNELRTRLQGENARRSPAKVVRARAAPVRSQAASLVGATESVKPARHSWPKTRPRPAVLPSSPLRHSIGHAPENNHWRTYMEMHAHFERAPTRLIPKSKGAAFDSGENMSPWSKGTTLEAIRRRAGLGTKFPVPMNALAEWRVFSGPFVDAPVLIGGRREERGVERERARRLAEARRGEVVPVPVPVPLEGEKAERKKRWQKFSDFLARKMSLKAKGAAPSPSSTPSSPATSSPRTPTTSPSLVDGTLSSNSTPARAPAVPAQVHFAAPVVISGPPYSPPRKSTAEKKQPISLPKSALKRASPPHCSTPQEEHIARAIASASASASVPRPRQIRYSPPIAEEAEEDEDDKPSPLPSLSDADLFPSPHVTSERWTRPREPQHEAIADAVAEETAAADWSGALKKAERVEYVGKGKGRMVDVKRPRPARYHGQWKVAQGLFGGDAGEGGARRDTLVVGEGRGPGAAWPLADGEGSKRPVVAISELRR